MSGLIDRFLTAYRQEDRGGSEKPGLVQTSAGDVFLIDPTGTRTKLGGAGGGGLLTYAENTTGEIDLGGPPTTIIDTTPLAFDGATAVEIEFYTPLVHADDVQITFRLWQDPPGDPTELGAIAVVRAATVAVQVPVDVRRFLTPTAGTHFFRVTAQITFGGGTGLIICGPGGPGSYMPGFLRISKA